MRHAKVCTAHFARRCIERGIPLEAEQVAETIRRTAPCWRQEGRRRYHLSVRLGSRKTVSVIWDDELDAPVSAWWAARNAHDPVEIHEGWR